MSYKDPIKRKERDIKYQADRNKDLKQHAYDSIISGKIIDTQKWNLRCNQIKNSAKTNNHPYSDDLTNDIMFDLMVQGCFYCDDVATTNDRVDSKLDHTLENCVGSCHGCNMSIGVSDPQTFVRKAYYRARGEYYDDDTNIWFVYKTKPSMWHYKKHAEKQGVPFELTKPDWEKLIKGNCVYCHRSPITWFGVDRVIPSLGYVLDNVESCCYDCNLDKLEDDVETMRARNKRIARRVDAGEFVIGEGEKVILHKGTYPFLKAIWKTVCARGRVYENTTIASKALVMGETYVKNCIREGRHSDDIFVITEKFYEEYKDSEMYITKNMFVAFDHYVNN